MHAKIEFASVTKRFSVKNGADGGGFAAVESVSLDAQAGTFTVIVGPSGCGKSTLLDLLAGFIKPTTGEVRLDGRTVTGTGLDRGIVFQQYALLPWRTALDNVALVLEAKGVPARQRRELARAQLSLVGLAGFEDRYPHELSGGMKQRVAIARSLAHDPDVLIMDEPFAALDAQTRETLQDELLRTWRRSGKTIVFVTHGIEEAVYLGQRVAVMSTRPGRIREIVEVPRALHEEDDARSRPEFGETRHRIWSLLREDVEKARQEEGHPPRHAATLRERWI